MDKCILMITQEESVRVQTQPQSDEDRESGTEGSFGPFRHSAQLFRLVTGFLTDCPGGMFKHHEFDSPIGRTSYNSVADSCSRYNKKELSTGVEKKSRGESRSNALKAIWWEESFYMLHTCRRERQIQELRSAR